MTNMNMRPDASNGYPGRSYRFYTVKTVYAFGDGLSYSHVTHHLVEEAPKLVSVPLEENHIYYSSNCKSVEAVETTCENLDFNLNLKVKNNGSVSGSHTVFLFSTPPSVHNSPKKHLLAFQKVFLRGQAEELFRFKVDVCKDFVIDEVGNRKLALGDHVLHVGNLKHFLSVRICINFSKTALLEHRPSQAVTPDRSSQLLHDPVDIQELSIDRTSQRTHPVNPSERRPPIDQSTVDPSGRSSRRDFILRIPRSQVDERGPSSSSARTDHHVPEQTPPPLRHGDRIPRSQVDERGPSSSSARTDPHVPEQTPPPLRRGDRIRRRGLEAEEDRAFREDSSYERNQAAKSSQQDFYKTQNDDVTE
ncbi:hypothetical protein LWI29_030712 [Acer saccharum]|uniref:Fibronectin type III-like domain-containing protein n=1 Tax=Acer saccharum TaxID=4024 RepID=A0AA39SEU9_ACESA|nr:hypothetical protein LWI29_030712 [Acer saccharum]